MFDKYTTIKGGKVYMARCKDLVAATKACLAFEKTVIQIRAGSDNPNMLDIQHTGVLDDVIPHLIGCSHDIDIREGSILLYILGGEVQTGPIGSTAVEPMMAVLNLSTWRRGDGSVIGHVQAMPEKILRDILSADPIYQYRREQDEMLKLRNVTGLVLSDKQYRLNDIDAATDLLMHQGRVEQAADHLPKLAGPELQPGSEATTIPEQQVIFFQLPRRVMEILPEH